MARSAPPSVHELLLRIQALEERLGRLEAGRPPPGDGRASAIQRPPQVTRCTGCGLPLRRRAGHCRECGVPLSP